MSASDALQPAQFLDLYHRTTPEAAEQIRTERRMSSKEQPPRGYFSTMREGGQADGYGEGVVHVRVPAHIAELDDEFPDGEEHYAVPLSKLRAEHFR